MKAFGVVLVGSVLVASCGGGGSSAPPTPPPPATFTIGGTVAGLAGSGLELRNNAGNPLAITANGAFTFSGTVASGSVYAVTVGAQPTSASQTCVVAAGSGTATANVTNVAVTCTTNAFAVGVVVDGLFANLPSGSVVLENNGGDPLTLSTNGAANFAINVASGAAYNVAVRTQPNGTPPQTCTVPGGTGTVGNGPITGIVVRCRAQAGRFLYVPGTTGVAAFAIDATSGSLMPIAGSPFALPSGSQAARVVFKDTTEKFLYVYGDDNISGPNATTLTGYTVSAQTGALAPIANLLVDLPAAASQVAVHPSGKFAYVPVSDSTQTANNRLFGFAIHPSTGILAILPGFPWGPFGPLEVVNGIVLSPSGVSLYIATSTPPVQPVTPATGTIRQLAVDSVTGELALTGSQVTDASNSFNQLFMHPNATHLYTRNSSSLAFTSRFRLDTTTGAIVGGGRVDISTLFGLGAVIAPASGFAYFPEFGGTFQTPGPGRVVGILDSAVSSPVTATPSSPSATGGTNSLAPMLDPTNRFLALTNLGTANITVMKVNSADGSLTAVAGSPFTPLGTSPGAVIFDPSARFAFLSDGQTSSVASYAVDVDTGVPTFVSSQPTAGVPGGVLTILGRQ